MAVQIINHVEYEPTTSVDFDMVSDVKPTEASTDF
jgi:hypothetical protein